MDTGFSDSMTPEPIAVNMALSTLLLRDIQQHRRSQNIRNATLGNMPEIRESPDEEDDSTSIIEATAALSTAVQNISTSNRVVPRN